MKHLLNTLFVTSEDIYLSLDGENVVANRDKQVVARYPMHNLFQIISFSYAGASPALMGACARNGELVSHFVRREENSSPVFVEKAAETCFCGGRNTAWRTTLCRAAALPGQ